MCSTPFGIKEGRTVQLSASQQAGRECSTPFGIKEGRTGASGAYATRWWVLNAFRHQRGSHEALVEEKWALSFVLNAFRHQRGSHNIPRIRLPNFVVCSTPFGIKEGRTRRVGLCPRLRSGVLNAFRHQRGSHYLSGAFIAVVDGCSTPFGIKEGRTPYEGAGFYAPGSAQRLSASKRVAPYSMVGVLPTGLCAQRLSASKRVARGKNAAQRQRLQVLNAFRHQRGSHRSIGVPFPGFEIVLNAFRHQRGSHLHAGLFLRPDLTRAQRLSASKRVARAPASGCIAADWCSTPFGIKEGRTRLSQRKGIFVKVLNAFRHQRGSHYNRALMTKTALEVLNAFRHQRGSHAGIQTPQATAA